jgi:hypothetical protein
LAVDWLKGFPDAKPSVQHDLIQIAERFGQRSEIRELAGQRIASPIADAELRAIWMGAIFITSFEDHIAELRTFSHESADRLWTFARASRAERGERWQPLSVDQLEFAFIEFAPRWPAAFHPVGGWSGNNHPWDASEYLRALVNNLGANSSKEASDALDRLSANDGVASYRDHIKHVRAEQLKLRRDTSYQVPTFQQVKSTLQGAVPERIDDLKAVTLDGLDIVQKYVRDGDTRAWSAYWSGGNPLTENDCRDRLLDHLRPHLPAPLLAMPEITMPNIKRSDIAVINGPLGLPIEIKGQWHPEVWTAPSSQLIDKYTRDCRANGRGIYLVLWFGNDNAKPLTPDPHSATPPTSPSEMRDRLLLTLSKNERSKVDIVVLDVSTSK